MDTIKGILSLKLLNNFQKLKKDIKIKFLRKRLDDISQIYCSNKRLLKIFPNWKKKIFYKRFYTKYVELGKKDKKKF